MAPPAELNGDLDADFGDESGIDLDVTGDSAGGGSAGQGWSGPAGVRWGATLAATLVLSGPVRPTTYRVQSGRA
jgi:hypothetical protein